MTGTHARPGLVTVLAVFFGILAGLTCLANVSTLSLWLFAVGDRIRALHYYSLLIEGSIAAYALCAGGLWHSKRWAWWLGVGWVVAAACSGRFLFLLPVGGMDVSRGGMTGSLGQWFLLGPAYWPLAAFIFLPNLVILGLMLTPGVLKHFGMEPSTAGRALKFTDAVLIRLLAVAQVLAAVALMLFSYGLGFLPPMLLYELCGVVAAWFLLGGRQIGRILSMAWYLLFLAVFCFNAIRISGHPEWRDAYPAAVTWVVTYAVAAAVYLGVTAWRGRRAATPATG